MLLSNKYPSVLRIEDFFPNGDPFCFPVVSGKTNVLARASPSGYTPSYYSTGAVIPPIQSKEERGVRFDLKDVPEARSDWSAEDVGDWLDLNNLGMFREDFVANDVDGYTLFHCSTKQAKSWDRFVGSLGKSFGLSQRLMHAVGVFGQDGGSNRTKQYMMSVDMKSSFAVFELMKHLGTVYPRITLVKFKSQDKPTGWGANRDTFNASSDLPRGVDMRNAKLVEVSSASHGTSYEWGGARDKVHYTVFFEASVFGFHEEYDVKEMMNFGAPQHANLLAQRNPKIPAGNSFVVSARNDIRKVIPWGSKIRLSYDILPRHVRQVVMMMFLTRRFDNTHPLFKFDLNLLELLLEYCFGYTFVPMEWSVMVDSPSLTFSRLQTKPNNAWVPPGGPNVNNNTKLGWNAGTLASSDKPAPKLGAFAGNTNNNNNVDNYINNNTGSGWKTGQNNTANLGWGKRLDATTADEKTEGTVEEATTTTNNNNNDINRDDVESEEDVDEKDFDLNCATLDDQTAGPISDFLKRAEKDPLYVCGRFGLALFQEETMLPSRSCLLIPLGEFGDVGVGAAKSFHAFGADDALLISKGEQIVNRLKVRFLVVYLDLEGDVVFDQPCTVIKRSDESGEKGSAMVKTGFAFPMKEKELIPKIEVLSVAGKYPEDESLLQCVSPVFFLVLSGTAVFTSGTAESEKKIGPDTLICREKGSCYRFAGEDPFVALSIEFETSK